MAEEDLGVLQTVRDLRAKTPFSPFRIVLSSGDSYDIESSELLAIGQSQLIYCLPHSDRVAHLRMNQIAAIEELDEQPRKRRKR